MKPWLKRTLLAFGALGIVGGGWLGFKLGHPAFPASEEQLPGTQLRAGTLQAQFFGATTLLLRDGDEAVMVDALLTRPGLKNVLFGKIAPDAGEVRRLIRAANVPNIDLLLVTHSHYDHALDVSEVARRTGSIVVGSDSTRQIALGGGVRDTFIRIVRGGEQMQAGRFKVRIFRSQHSPGDAIPGEIRAPLRPPASVKDYKTGGTFSYLIENRGVRSLVHASSGYIPGMYHGVRADVVFLATGGLGFQSGQTVEQYWNEVVRDTGAKLVIPIHWDDFLQGLDQPLQPLRRFMDDIPSAMTRIDALAARDGVSMRYMPIVRPVDVSSAVRAARANNERRNRTQ